MDPVTVIFAIAIVMVSAIAWRVSQRHKTNKEGDEEPE